MDEIKFRLWDKDYKRFYFLALTKDGVIKKMPENEPVGDIAFPQQYTSLKDKNGKEMCEGDIIRVPENNAQPISVIEKDVSIDGDGYMISGFHFPFFDTKYVEVIGNIYENPELIENEKAPT